MSLHTYMCVCMYTYIICKTDRSKEGSFESVEYLSYHLFLYRTNLLPVSCTNL